MISLLENKRIILGVTGSIAAYKAADLASKLTQAGALVDVILTEAAQKFISPLTFQSLTGRPTYTDLWASAGGDIHIAHVGLGEGADLMLIAPCTANTLAKLATGQANDLLSVTYLAARCPVLLAPAMDGGMYEHLATQTNIEILQNHGVRIIPPENGRFASGLEGPGRLPETPALLGEIRQALAQKGPLAGRRVVVSAGGTREAIDPVRFISNHSSGRQGYALAQAALDAGAEVILVSTVELPTPYGAKLIRVASAAEMQAAMLAHADSDVLIMAAAVADFRPSEVADQKIKKSGAAPQIELSKNEDILALIGEERRQTGRPSVLVGFAAETQNLLQNATEKLQKKNADLIIANDVTAEGAGFASANNQVSILSRHDEPESLGLMSKTLVAEVVIQRIADLLN